MRSLTAAVLTTLVACAAAPPREPADLSLPALRLGTQHVREAMSLSQRLTFHTPEGPERSLDALLELDDGGLRLAAFALGQRVFTMSWDGETLREERTPRVPDRLDAGQVLRDIQLVYWPPEAIRGALPPGWRLEDAPGSRTLLVGDRECVRVIYDGQPRWLGQTELVNQVEHYRLVIQSRLNEG